MSVSILVCYYNSARTIEKCIRSILDQSYLENFSDWELLLVDNNSNDSSNLIINNVLRERRDANQKIKYIFEPKQGLMNARKAGVGIAKYETIIFVDDDNYLHDRYVEMAVEAFEKNNNIGVLGGRCLLDKNSAIRNLSYLKGKYGLVAIGDQGDREGVINDRGYVWGAGMAVKTDVIQWLVGSDYPFVNTGRTGKDTSAGDDREICLIYQLLGYDLFYSPRMKLVHDVDPSRLNQIKLSALQVSIKESNKRLRGYESCLNINKYGGGALWKYLQNSSISLFTRFKYCVIYITSGNKIISRLSEMKGPIGEKNG